MASRRILVLGVLAVTGVAIASASGKGVGRVTLGDTTLSPTVVKIGVGSAVLWTNRGLHRHRIASTTNAWAPFVLAKGASKSVTFAKAGSYPYRVDGKRPGVVLVVTSLGATEPGQSTFKPYHYRVTVHVVTHFDRTDPDGADSTDVDWKGTWPDVTVRALVSGATIVVSTTKLAVGQIDAEDDWSHSDPKTGGPCNDTFQDSARATLSLNGTAHQPSSHFFLADFLTSPTDTFLSKVAEQQHGECKGFGTTGPQSWNLGDLSQRLQGPSGLTAQPNEGLLTLHLENPKRPTPYPIDLLAHHDSFQFQTEPLLLHRTTGNEKTTGKAEVTVVFTARPYRAERAS